MKRRVDYTWRLAELMAARGMHNSTELIPLLAERGTQPVHRTNTIVEAVGVGRALRVDRRNQLSASK